jgi:hypothetical protein
MVECATIEDSYIGSKFRMVGTITKVESCVLELHCTWCLKQLGSIMKFATSFIVGIWLLISSNK